jgi:hypothetical protein
MLRQENSGQNRHTEVANKPVENVTMFDSREQFWKLISMREEIKSRLISENSFNHSAQNFLSAYLLSKNIKIRKITYILFVVTGMKLALSHWGKNVDWEY